MNGRPKRVPRLWCALQGLLPIESCLAAQRAELAWPPDSGPENEKSAAAQKTRNRIAVAEQSIEVRQRASLRNQGGDCPNQRQRGG